jgi:hypothetical protein
LERQLPEAALTLTRLSETIWRLRQPLTASVARTLVEHHHQEEQRRTHLHCATCERLLRARPGVPRTAQTLGGDIELERPYFYCRHCQCGRYPLDETLGLQAGRMQLDVQQAAVDLATEPRRLAPSVFSLARGTRPPPLTPRMSKGRRGAEKCVYFA